MAIMQPHGPLLKLHQFRNDGGAAVFRGDLVEMDVDGKISAAEATDTQLYGVSLTYVAASTTTNVPVACDPDQWFEGDQDGTVAVVNIGSNMDHAVGSGGSTTPAIRRTLSTLPMLNQQLRGCVSSTKSGSQTRLIRQTPRFSLSTNTRSKPRQGCTNN